MKKQEIYDHIEEKAKIGCNGKYFFSEDPKYEFEPGTTSLPDKLELIYHSSSDKAIISLEGKKNNEFMNELKIEMKGCSPRIYGSSNNANLCLMEFDNFKKLYGELAQALEKIIDNKRLFLPKLTTTNFNQEDKNEYSLKTENGNLWIPEYICHGAFYTMLFTAFDLHSFEDYESLKEYATQMIRIKKDLKKEYFNVSLKNAAETIDLEIKAEAVSKDKVKKDLEKIIEIVS